MNCLQFSEMSEHKQRDAFISYASEDKEEVALPLFKFLKEAGLEGWLDQEEIRLGDSIPDGINQVLAELRGVGLVIASPHYFEKAWTN